MGNSANEAFNAASEDADEASKRLKQARESASQTYDNARKHAKSLSARIQGPSKCGPFKYDCDSRVCCSGICCPSSSWECCGKSIKMCCKDGCNGNICAIKLPKFLTTDN